MQSAEPPGGNPPPPPSDTTLVCNCLQLCNSVLTVFTDRRKWRRHAKYREGPAEFFERRQADFRAQGAQASGALAPLPPQPLGQLPPRIDPLPPAAARLGEAMQALQEVGAARPSSDDHVDGEGGSRSPSPMQVEPPGRLPIIEEPRMLHDDDPPEPQPDEQDEQQADPIYGYTEDVDVPRQARRREVAEVQEFISQLRAATLDESGLSAGTVARLRSPPHRVPTITDPERAGIRMFLARGDASEDNYTDNRAAMVELHPEDEKTVPTYEQAKRLVSNVTGIDALVHHMCVNSCLAFTGPFAQADTCPICKEPRYDQLDTTNGRQIPRRTFHTYPLGPQLQAMYASPENARLMRHRAERTEEIRAQLAADPDSAEVLDDIYWGNDYLAAVNDHVIEEDDIVLMFSLDGAQLYESKASDTWFYIWVLFDLPPTSRYRKRFVLPGGVIGGPKKPKNVDSFLFPGLHHVAALQREGLEIWDAAREVQFTSKLFLYLATADGPGMAYLSGLVGHQGARGCRLYCGLLGRFKPSASTYYPALYRSHDNPHDGSDHPDADPTGDPEPSAIVSTRYTQNLQYVISSRSHAEYQRRRLETGIAKPSIFSGLPRTLSLPGCFGADLMHLVTLNLTDLLVSHLRGTIQCDPTDDRASWDWAVLGDPQVWRAHGRLVQDATRYLPGSFDRPPRNPAEKISSGYKAWEFLLYVYGLLPGLLRGVLPAPYYFHFCKLVYGIRIMLQHSIPLVQVSAAHVALVEYAMEYEELYYARRADRLHFVRQSVHALIHIAPEALRLGPGSLYTQWTLENFIGNITREIKQHSTPYANVSERALRRTRINALQAAITAFAPDEEPPLSSVDLGDRYRLLRARERGSVKLTTVIEQNALFECLHAHDIVIEPGYKPAVQRWARLRLPNGQIARSLWKEGITESRGRECRRARMVKLTNNRFAEVQFFFLFNMPTGQRAFAMISYFSTPDHDMLTDSHNVLVVCTYRGGLSRAVIDVKMIESVVAMVPLPLTETEVREVPGARAPGQYGSHFFVVEKPGLAVAVMGGVAERMDNSQDDVDDAEE